MTKRTLEEVLDAATTETAAALADGLDPSDLAILVRNGIEIAEELDDLDGPAKRALAHAYAGQLVDTFFEIAGPEISEAIASVDIPFLPEALERAVVDPLLERVAMSMLRLTLKSALPGLIDLVIDATKGKVGANLGGDGGAKELAERALELLDAIAKPGVSPSTAALEALADMARAELGTKSPEWQARHDAADAAGKRELEGLPPEDTTEVEAEDTTHMTDGATAGLE